MSGRRKALLSKASDTRGMSICNAASHPSKCTGATGPVLTPDEALRERAERARKSARDCVLVAVVASPPISAELIDKAVWYAQTATNEPAVPV